MKWVRPVIVELTADSQGVRAASGACANGTGDADNCYTGHSPALACFIGNEAFEGCFAGNGF